MSIAAIIGLIILSLIVSAILFVVLREVIMWYFKINKRIEQNDEIIRLLEVIAYGDEEEDKEEPELEVIKNNPEK